MQDIELFITWVGLSITCLYPADNVRADFLIDLVTSFCHYLEQRALKSPVTIENKGYS